MEQGSDFERQVNLEISHEDKEQCDPLLRFNIETYNQPVAYLLDWQSFKQISKYIKTVPPANTPIDNINNSIIKPHQSQNAQYLEEVLIEGLSESSKDNNLKIKIISSLANKVIFEELGFEGHQIKRKVIRTGKQKYIELYPLQMSFSVVSPRFLYNWSASENSKGELHLPQFKINYYEDDNMAVFKDNLVRAFRNYDRRTIPQIRIYKYESAAFKSISFEKILLYYFRKEDLKVISLEEQQKFYKLINNKEDDPFLVECFPGKLIQEEGKVGDILSKEDKLIIECFSDNKWVFPQQPFSSKLGKCRFCRQYSHLFIKFECKGCRSVLFFCSRVCHYLSLSKHSCSDAEEELNFLYDSAALEDVITVSNSASQQTNAQKGDAPNSPIPISTSSQPRSLISIGNQEKDKRKNQIKKGIFNIGNSCYINSTIQLLSRSVFSTEFLTYKTNGNQPLLISYIKLLMCLYDSTPENYINENIAEEFKTVIDSQISAFRGNKQQDAHEFLTFFLEALHKETLTHSTESLNLRGKDKDGQKQWLQFISRNNSPIVSWLYGQTIERLKCCDCNFQQHIYSPFAILSCPIPQNIQSSQFKLYYQSTEKRTMKIYGLNCQETVEKLLEKFCKSASITGQSKYHSKLFLTSYEHEIKQLDRYSKMSDVSKQLDNYSGKAQLLVSIPLFAETKVIFVRFNTQHLESFTFKRPFFFKNEDTLTYSMIFETVLQYLLLMFSNDPQPGNNINKKEVQSWPDNYFTMTHFKGGKINKNNIVTFSKPGTDFDRKSFEQVSLDDGINQFWIVLKITRQTSLTFLEKIASETNNFQETDKSNDFMGCLKEQFKPITLSNGNEWKCTFCQKKRRASKETSLIKAGRFLIIHLKRFKQNSKKNIQKNSIKIQPLVGLNLSNILQSNTLPESYYSDLSSDQKIKLNLPEKEDLTKSCFFQLKGMILHQGTTRTGHYKAACEEDNEWWEFQDEKTKKIDINKYLDLADTQKQVYILLYQRIVN